MKSQTLGMCMPYVLVTAILAGVLCSCAAPSIERPDLRQAEILRREPLVNTVGDSPLASEERDTPPAELVTATEVGPITPTQIVASATAETAPRELPTQMITDLDLADTVDIVTLLRVMAKSADVNMLISPSVSGDIGFSFRDVPWDQAFRSVLSSAGLTYAWQGDVLKVMTIEDVRRELEMETALKDRETVREQMRLAEPMILQVIPVRHLTAEKVGETIRGMLTGRSKAGTAGTIIQTASVSVDSESNSLVVHAVRSDVEKALRLVEVLDRPRPLIRIEAKIVEATRDTARQLGMQWGGSRSRLDGSRIYTVGGAGASAEGYASDFPAHFASSGDATMGFTLGMASARLGGGELLNVQLTALQQQGQIDIRSSPIVTTLDNEKALIESGEERAYRVSTGTGTALEGTLEWKKAVLSLEVTPHVVEGRRLRVQIAAHKDSFDETKPQSNNEFPVNTKRAFTTVMLDDGETTMIGGLSLESDSDVSAGVPILMHIPLLGYLFRNNSTAGRFDETIIFITPTIL